MSASLPLSLTERPPPLPGCALQLAQRNQVEQAKAHAHRIAQSCFPEDVKRVIITDMYFEKNRKCGRLALVLPVSNASPLALAPVADTAQSDVAR